ncbi:acid phosphatase type 7 [Exaiptasia diaphana]|uniref:Purple acid phosphatase n=1 Tax=Exaiptasia diaphana TaxID=2652724 RepID=A0A913XBK4_EXADI|nr:acid phosphatase type 7 [Exaiptasia diaphana]
MTTDFLFIVFIALLAGQSIVLHGKHPGNQHISSPQPEQIHISRTGDQSEMMVTWTTLLRPNNSFVEFGVSGGLMNTKVPAKISRYVTCGKAKRVIYIHKVKLTGLLPSTSYDYHCGGDDGWSAIYSFSTTKQDSHWSPSFAVYGDLGVINAQSLAPLQKEVQNGRYDAILHVGKHIHRTIHLQDNSRVGDAFMNQIETMAAYVPYMVSPGNHEHHCNFSNYRRRFSMPGNNSGIFYSWNIGPVHIISFSTEVYYFLKYGLQQIINQYEWLKKDLEEANLPENRAKRPWIITMGHRPMYCSNVVGDDCQNFENKVRIGITSLKLFPLEKLFYENGVDLEIWAHEHSYERLFPVYNHTVYNGSIKHPYTNPRAPVHIITGSAGCKYCHDKFKRKNAKWTAFRTLDYGYTRMKVYNKTHLHLEQVSIDKNYTVVDQVMIIKNQHGPEAWKWKQPEPPPQRQKRPKVEKLRTSKKSPFDELAGAKNILNDYIKQMKSYKSAYL